MEEDRPGVTTLRSYFNSTINKLTLTKLLNDSGPQSPHLRNQSVGLNSLQIGHSIISLPIVETLREAIDLLLSLVDVRTSV